MGFRGRKRIARWTERIGLKWAITKSAWGKPYPPPTLAEAREWFQTTPRNQFYDDHFVGVKNKSTHLWLNKLEKTDGYEAR